MLLLLAFGVVASTTEVAAYVNFVITKTNDAPNPIQSGQVFTYTITYSWSGGVGWSSGSPGNITVTDAVPSTLDVISTAPGSPVGTIAGNNVTFNLTPTAPSGSYSVQINVRFKPGVTCPGTEACNQAYISTQGQDPIASNRSCAVATATNKWQFWKDYISGCAVDSVDEVVYRINLYNPPGGDIGGLNLINVSLTDILPTGAIITDVVPFNVGDWSGPFPSTGSVLMTGGATSFNVSPAMAWYGCYVKVRYPAGLFVAGQTVTNNATLRFETPCSRGQVMSFNDNASNTLCDPTPPPPTALGAIYKWLSLSTYFPANPWYFPSWAPGCCGTYTVYYHNYGTLTQSNIVIDDTPDPTVDVNSITTYQPPTMTSVALDIYCYVAGTCSPTPTTTITYSSPGSWNTYTASGLPGPICRVRWRYTGTLATGQYLYNTMGICVRTNSYVAPFPAVVAGQNISNTACITGTNVPPGPLCATNNSTVTATAPNILAAKYFAGKSGTCLPTCSPDMTGPFYPGDVVRFRMIVANVGSATATPCTITDNLPAGFSYMGNPTYYYGPLWWAGATNPSCCSMTATPPSVIGGLSSPPIGATSLTWNFPTLPATCSGNVDYLVIEFDVKASNTPTIPPGNYFNTFTFSAGNLGTPVVSNPAQVTINGYAGVEIFKEVRPNLTGTSFGPSAGVQAGSQAEFRLRVNNTGILTLTNLRLLDITPHVGDITVLPLPSYTARGSAYNMQISLPMTAPSGFTVGYNGGPVAAQQNPQRSPIFSGIADPGGSIFSTFGAWPGPTYSFLIQGAPGWIAPGGTQDFFFVGTVPASAIVGQNACNSFGLQVTPNGMPTNLMRAEATPACVDVIPPDKNECEQIWGQPEFGECCSFKTNISNMLGSLTELHYNVLPIGGSGPPSGVVQNIITNPCTPSSTSPPSIPGTTSGTLFYSPPCPNPLDVEVFATSTTASGEICIELIAVFVRADGTKIECKDTICFHCDPAPNDRCDSMNVIAAMSKNKSLRTFTIYNLKSPASQICSVQISVTPPPGGSGLSGSGLFVDGTGHSWTAASSFGFTQINGTHGLPANTTVQFTLGVDYGIGWVGNVLVTTYHCDGTICEMQYGPWDAGKKGPVIIGNPTDVPDKATLHMHSLSFSRADAADLGVRYIGVYYNDPVTEVVAVTGATYPCDVDEQQGANCNDIFEGMHVKGASMMIDLRRDLADPRNQQDPLVTVVYRASNDQAPTAEIIYYDANGQEVGHQDVDITPEDPPGRAVSGLNGNEGLDGYDRVAAVMGALTARPNPTSGNCDVGFKLQSAATVDLELVDAQGRKITTLITGEHLAAGEHHRLVDLTTISSGTYMVTLRINGVPSVLRLELIK